ELEAAITDLTLLSRKQEGCLRYDCFQSVEASGRFMLVVQWQDEESLRKHLDSQHVLEFFLETARKLAAEFLAEDYRNFSRREMEF
ncbi:MAG: antibiotic biosynthesis monooxygenase, partial [Deltaproteobacteria bacterium]|nr:antibiotic biosynthesis monooxygenase [Deltaproteobacteria bacterium]